MPKNKQPFDYRQAAGIYIGNGVKATGELDVHDDIIIDGDYEGSITTSGFCEVTENGQLTADLSAHGATIFGHFKGHIQTEEGLVVKNTADVDGFLTYGSLTIQPGATVRARIKPSESHL